MASTATQSQSECKGFRVHTNLSRTVHNSPQASTTHQLVTYHVKRMGCHSNRGWDGMGWVISSIDQPPNPTNGPRPSSAICPQFARSSASLPPLRTDPKPSLIPGPSTHSVHLRDQNPKSGRLRSWRYCLVARF